MDSQKLLELYRAMLTSRYLDQLELEITSRGEAFFQVSGTGHEGSAVLQLHLNDSDWLHCHYRDKALLIARGVPPKDFFDTFYCKEAGRSRGRQMSDFMSHRELHVLSQVVPVANHALQAVGVAASVREQASRPIVVCAMGDGSTQQGEFLEASSEAVRSRLPVLFFIEDNRWAISTKTSAATFYSLPNGDAKEFLGRPIHRIDGRDPVAAANALEPIVAEMRESRQPAFVVFDVERLSSHTNADDQALYRDSDEIRRAFESGDPIRRLEKSLLEYGVAESELGGIRDSVKEAVAAAEEESVAGPDPQPEFNAKKPIPVELTHPSRERRGDEETGELTMREAIRSVLRDHLNRDRRVCLFGEDIEDPKGDVFGVTKGLSTEFGSRVKNSPLTESTILGTSIGRGLVGDKPVAFLQFADFLPLALNQIISEMSTMHWRTAGEWSVPVVVMVACGGYRPGLGPFHSQTFESLLANTPGIDVFMPSTAADAVGMLNAAFLSNRPTIFFYPKNCLNDPANTTSKDVARQFVPIGPARKVRSGRDISFVGWGNTIRLCKKVAEALDVVGVESEVLDLRSISPWDTHAVLSSAEKTARMIVVHEDNHTCGLGAEVLATVAEKARVPVALRRIARPDTHVPCNFANQIDVLPSFRSVLSTAADLLNLDLSWEKRQRAEVGISHIEAVGSGPADESVMIVELMIEPGQRVDRGDPVAQLEATKSVFELTSPVSGVVEAVLAMEGESVTVGSPLVRVRSGAQGGRRKPTTQEDCGQPILKRRPTDVLHLPKREFHHRAFEVGMSAVATVSGHRNVTNHDLLAQSPGMTVEEVFRLTGIEQRHWVAEGQNAVNMAVKACWDVLDQERLIIDDLDLVICSTTTPTVVTPSMACQVLNGMTGGKSDAMLQAYDINAACSGYLYALQAGYDFLQSRPNGRVMVVTAEVLSPLLDPADLDTAILFGDATSATILYGEDHLENSSVRLLRPEVSAKGEDGSTLSVPFLNDGFIQMKGRRVFSEAVRSMTASLNRVCSREGVDVGALKMIVPHQANQRIIDAIQTRVDVDVFSNIRTHGNTSSSSIPLCLSDVLPGLLQGDRIGLCAFGGGFTFGAGILVAT